MKRNRIGRLDKNFSMVNKFINVSIGVNDLVYDMRAPHLRITVVLESLILEDFKYLRWYIINSTWCFDFCSYIEL